MNTTGVLLRPLETGEMLALSGGMEIAPSLLTDAAYDLGYYFGRALASVAYLATHPTSSNYYYCKTGYPG